jgi:1,4-alpha-glucan branching enzyme
MGAQLVADGATFRVWAPEALAVYASGEFNDWQQDDSCLLVRDERGYWRGFIPGVGDWQAYNYYVVGRGSSGYKRDPYARELVSPWPGASIVRSPSFAWHETDYRPPMYHELIIYQLHVGTYYTPNWPRKAGTFLDVATRIPYLLELGINAIQLLPIVEFQTRFSKGYNGTDYFSPEMDYGLDDDQLDPYLARINEMLAARQQAPWSKAELTGGMNQLKALIDLCHVHGVAVILDVVYNHAGGDFGDESIYFFDRQPGQHETPPDFNRSLYFIDRGHAGGLIFAIWREEVRQFLIDNASFLLSEYRIDGLRYDQVSVLTSEAAGPAWPFWQDLTSTVRYVNPASLQKAEFWPVNPDVVKRVQEGGAGFDTTLTDGLRLAIRDVMGGASVPGDGPLNMTRLAHSLWPSGFPATWRFVEGPENHDLVYRGREPRLPTLADPSNPRSWYARSRARVATGLALAAPGIPMLFMGQEFLEMKQWADDLDFHGNLRLDWAGVESGDRSMVDHLRFIRELCHLRQNRPGLQGEGFRVVHVHDVNRVLAFHRWVPGQGHDLLVVVSLANVTRYRYRIGVPGGGTWRELFNSDVYDHWVNPLVAGNGGGVQAQSIPDHGFEWSVELVLPANSLIVLGR